MWKFNWLQGYLIFCWSMCWYFAAGESTSSLANVRTRCSNPRLACPRL